MLCGILAEGRVGGGRGFIFFHWLCLYSYFAQFIDFQENKSSPWNGIVFIEVRSVLWLKNSLNLFLLKLNYEKKKLLSSYIPSTCKKTNYLQRICNDNGIHVHFFCLIHINFGYTGTCIVLEYVIKQWNLT